MYCCHNQTTLYLLCVYMYACPLTQTYCSYLHIWVTQIVHLVTPYFLNCHSKNQQIHNRDCLQHSLEKLTTDNWPTHAVHVTLNILLHLYAIVLLLVELSIGGVREYIYATLVQCQLLMSAIVRYLSCYILLFHNSIMNLCYIRTFVNLITSMNFTGIVFLFPDVHDLQLAL